ncbi:MAG: peptidoglycan-binding protein [Clostridia bacterium]|nr:peptidoglycan-binding protein [Clostridia bacterium]
MADPITIPEFITVHLGRPEEPAQNVTVSFPDYVKNVASGEIYPTWPEASLVANIFAIVSFALNRIFLRYYRSQGYDFDITNSTSIDQSYSEGRNVFENISDIVDNMFNDYVRVPGRQEPLATKFCNGTTTTCEGLSQWGTVDLAEQGYTALEILKYYYGDNIEIVYNAPVGDFSDFYSGNVLRLGDEGIDVYNAQILLNRISDNYPAIPKIYPLNGVFDENMENAVKKFQQIFRLNPDGIIGRQTGFKLVFLYVGIKRLTELNSEGILLGEIPKYSPPENTVQQEGTNKDYAEGDTGEGVRIIQYWLSFASAYFPTIPAPPIDGVFGSSTENSVLAFQKQFDLRQTGRVDNLTWNELYNVYAGILKDEREEIETQFLSEIKTPLMLGDSGERVKQLQKALNNLKSLYPEIPRVMETGTYGQRTRLGVMAIQKRDGISPSGVADSRTLEKIDELTENLNLSKSPAPLQYPGYELSIGMSDAELRRNGTTLTTPIYHLNEGLRQAAFVNMGIPLVVPQTHFVSDTEDAVKALQSTAGLPVTGIVDFATMEFIRSQN